MLETLLKLIVLKLYQSILKFYYTVHQILSQYNTTPNIIQISQDKGQYTLDQFGMNHYGMLRYQHSFIKKMENMSNCYQK